MFGWEAAANNVIAFVVGFWSLGVLFVEIIDIYIFDLVQFQEINNIFSVVFKSF